MEKEKLDPSRFEQMLSDINNHLAILLKNKDLKLNNLKIQIENKIDYGLYQENYKLKQIHKQQYYERDIQNILEGSTIYYNQLRTDFCSLNNIKRIQDKNRYDEIEKIQFQKLTELNQIFENNYSTGFFSFGDSSPGGGFGFFETCCGSNLTQQQKRAKAEQMSLFLNDILDQTKQKNKQQIVQYQQEDFKKMPTQIYKKLVKNSQKKKQINFFKRIWDTKTRKQQKVHTIQEIDLTQNVQAMANKYLNFSKLYAVMHLLQMSKIDPNIINKVPKKPYKEDLLSAIKTTILDVKPQHQSDNYFMELRQPVIKDLQQLQKEIQLSEDGTKNYYYQHQCWQILLIFVFKRLTKGQYNAYRRRIVRNVYNRFATTIDNELGVLRILQNLTFNIQVQPVPFFTLQQDKQFKTYQQKQILSIHNKLSHQDPQFTKGKSENQFPANFSLTKLTDISQRRKVVTILISGFLSQDNNKSFEWGGMIHTMKDSEVYALQWKSTTIGGMMKYLGSASLQILGAKGKGGLYGKAMSVANAFREKFDENPFTSSFQVAQRTGKYLGQLIIRLFPRQFINLLGYSLGSQLILSTIRQIRKNNMDLMMNKIIMMGGVTDFQELDKISRSYRTPIQVINCFTQNDTVLKYLLKACMPDVKPIGLYELPDNLFQGHVLQDKDCSDFIGGHLAYMANWKVLGRFLDMKDQ